jgi:hypothetical protein
MKLAMFTPAAEASAIARSTRLVVRALRAQGHEVSVVRTELDQVDDVHDFECELIPWTDDELVVDVSLSADMCVYQVGNHYPFHAGSLRWLHEMPGIVCLHDQFVGHLFDAWVSVHDYDPDPIVRAWYGDQVADTLAVAGAEIDLEERVRLAPMTEWIAARALGVMTHGDWTIDRLLRACHGPVQTAPLPY